MRAAEANTEWRSTNVLLAKLTSETSSSGDTVELGEAGVGEDAVGGVRIRSDEEIASIVVHFWEKVASTFGCHVK